MPDPKLVGSRTKAEARKRSAYRPALGRVEGLISRRPGLEKRNCCLDRNRDILHYLLSATRRDEPSSDADRAIDRAFDAGEVIAEHVRAGQGALVRYLPPTVVADVAEVVSEMSHATLLTYYHPVRMEAAHVYKFWADRG